MSDPLFTMIPDSVLRGLKYGGVHCRDLALVLSYLIRLVQARRLDDLTVARVARVLRMDRKTVRGTFREIVVSWGIVTEKYGNCYRDVYGNSYRDIGELLPKLSGIVTQQEKRKETKRDRTGRFSNIGNSSLVTNKDRGPDGTEGRVQGGEPPDRPPPDDDEPMPKPPDLEQLEGWHQADVDQVMVTWPKEGRTDTYELMLFDEEQQNEARGQGAVVIPMKSTMWVNKNGRPLNLDEMVEERERQKKYRESVSQNGGQTNVKAKTK